MKHSFSVYLSESSFIYHFFFLSFLFFPLSFPWTFFLSSDDRKSLQFLPDSGKSFDILPRLVTICIEENENIFFWPFLRKKVIFLSSFSSVHFSSLKKFSQRNNPLSSTLQNLHRKCLVKRPTATGSLYFCWWLKSPIKPFLYRRPFLLFAVLTIRGLEKPQITRGKCFRPKFTYFKP